MTRDIGRWGVVVGAATVLLLTDVAHAGPAYGSPGTADELNTLPLMGWVTRPTVPPPPPPPPGCTPGSPDPDCQPKHFCGLSVGTPVYGVRCCRILGGCEP